MDDGGFPLPARSACEKLPGRCIAAPLDPGQPMLRDVHGQIRLT
jgi:hypothetical protein